MGLKGLENRPQNATQSGPNSVTTGSAGQSYSPSPSISQQGPLIQSPQSPVKPNDIANFGVRFNTLQQGNAHLRGPVAAPSAWIPDVPPLSYLQATYGENLQPQFFDQLTEQSGEIEAEEIIATPVAVSPAPAAAENEPNQQGSKDSRRGQVHRVVI